MAVVAAVASIAVSTLSAVGQLKQAQAARKQGNYVGAIEDQNAKFSEMQADDAIARGYEAAFKRRIETNQLAGTSRAAMAAQGIDVNTGSALDIQENNQRIGELDMVTIKNNAARQAWGYQVEALQHRQQAHLARIGGANLGRNYNYSAGSTLLTGGAQAYGIWKNR
jgi:hypothetical protein